jgi:hypothetical protein
VELVGQGGATTKTVSCAEIAKATFPGCGGGQPGSPAGLQQHTELFFARTCVEGGRPVPLPSLIRDRGWRPRVVDADVRPRTTPRLAMLRRRLRPTTRTGLP